MERSMSINWRTDVENAPKDGSPILVVDNRLSREWCIFSVRVVSWEELRADEGEYGWVYGYDHEDGFPRQVMDFKYWQIINQP